jgi:uncharacterized protein (DUF2141 family)
MLLVLLFPCSLFAQEQRGNIVIEINGLKNSDGQVGILLFSREEGFPMDHTRAVKWMFAGINRNMCRVTLEHIPYGLYGVSVFHDENADGKLRKNIFGIPVRESGPPVIRPSGSDHRHLKKRALS